MRWGERILRFWFMHDEGKPQRNLMGYQMKILTTVFIVFALTLPALCHEYPLLQSTTPCPSAQSQVETKGPAGEVVTGTPCEQTKGRVSNGQTMPAPYTGEQKGSDSGTTTSTLSSGESRESGKYSAWASEIKVTNPEMSDSVVTTNMTSVRTADAKIRASFGNEANATALDNAELRAWKMLSKDRPNQTFTAEDYSAFVVERFGILRIESLPVGAEVKVDDVDWGTTATERATLMGKRHVVLTLDGYEPKAADFDAIAGQVKTFKVKLRKKSVTNK
jgi:hypothetical protein